MCFPEVRGTAAESNAFYRWKYHGMPGAVASYEYVARLDGEMVGYYAAIPYPYVIGGMPMMAGMVCDVMTHPKVRGKGVFTTIGRYATQDLEKRGVNFTTGYPVRPEVIPGHLRVGWEQPFDLPVYLSPVRSDAVLAAMKLGVMAPAGNLLLRVWNRVLAPRKAGAAKGVRVEVVGGGTLNQLEGLPEFLEEWRATQKYCLGKDLTFLGWRLGTVGAEYDLTLLREGTRIVGMAITRSTTLRGIPTLAIVDLMAVPKGIEEISHLLSRLRQLAVERGVDVVAGMFTRTWARRYRLLGNGFLRAPVTFKFITKYLNNPVDKSDFLKEDNWHLTWVDSDDL